MVFAEDIRKTILKLAEERGPESSFAPMDVASLVDVNRSQELIEQIHFVASVLIREGKITVASSDLEQNSRTPRFRKVRTAS